MLDLVSRQITAGGEMATPRRSFHAATIISGGQEKLLALAGHGSGYLNTVEEWVEESSTWKAANNLVKARNDCGAFTIHIASEAHLPIVGCTFETESL